MKDLMELQSVPEIFVDGFTNHACKNGVMSCVGYRTLPSGNVVVLRLVWPAVNTVEAINDAVSAMAPESVLRH